MRNECHACGGRGILAVGGGNDDGVEPERHRHGADATGREQCEKCVRLGEKEQTEQGKNADHNGGDDNKTKCRCKVDALLTEHLAKIGVCDGDTGQDHGDGGHAVGGDRDGREDLRMNGNARKTDHGTDDHGDEHGVGKCFERAFEAGFISFRRQKQEGHGVGVKIHEAPRLSPKGMGILQNGNVFTIEPGVYLNNEFGVRIENTVYLENDKCKSMMQSKLSLI